MINRLFLLHSKLAAHDRNRPKRSTAHQQSSLTPFVTRVTEFRFPEIPVASEESRLFEPMEERETIRPMHPFMAMQNTGETSGQ